MLYHVKHASNYLGQSSLLFTSLTSVTASLEKEDLTLSRADLNLPRKGFLSWIYVWYLIYSSSLDILVIFGPIYDPVSLAGCQILLVEFSARSGHRIIRTSFLPTLSPPLPPLPRPSSNLGAVYICIEESTTCLRSWQCALCHQSNYLLGLLLAARPQSV